jgi:hypothetical protein
MKNEWGQKKKKDELGYAFPYTGFENRSEKLSNGGKCIGLSGGNSLFYGPDTKRPENRVGAFAPLGLCLDPPMI